MAVQFNIDSRHVEDARFKKVLFGYDGELLEVELNELQDIFNSRSSQMVDKVFGSRPLYVGTYAYATGTLTITNEVVAINKELVVIPSATIAATSGDTIYLNIQDKTVTKSDTIKKYGSAAGSEVVTNYLEDPRMGQETTRRVQVTYQLTKTNVGTGTFLKLCTITAGAVVKSATDYADSDLYKEIRRLASEVIAANTDIETKTGAQAKATAAETAAINWAKGFGLGDVAKSMSGDANDINLTGFYKGYNLTNQPTGDASNDFYYLNFKHNDAYKFQMAINYASGRTYRRALANSVWTAWSELETTAGAAAKVKVTQDDLTAHKGSGGAAHAAATTSANGFMSSGDKTKLDGIAAGANNYVHPATHPPSIIVQDASNRFVTDAEKAAWNSKSGTAVATTTSDGLMSSGDKTKLNGIATGAEVNQNSFSTVKVGTTNVAASAKTDTVELAGGTGVTATADATGKKVTFAVDSTIETTTGAQSKATAAQNAAINWAKGFGLGGIAKSVNGVDMDTVTDSGFYQGYTMTNAAVTSISTFLVIQYSPDWVVQLQFVPANGTQKAYQRGRYSGTSWSAWREFAGTEVATASANGLMASGDKSKLDGIASGANNYTHPATHPPSIIAQDASNRFVTDAEKTTWNGKASTAVATTSANGLMSSTDKSKLDGVASGAEVNQNAFSTVNAGGTNLAADSKADTLTMTGGTGINVTGDANTDTVTISVNSTIETTTGAQTKADSAQTSAINWAKGFGLGSTAKSVSGGDLNTLTAESGLYMGSAMTNAPTTAWYLVINMRHNGSYGTQLAYDFTNTANPLAYQRLHVNGTWTAWKQAADVSVASTSANGLMSSGDKSKLDGIAAGANNYTHPATHPPSIIAQDASNRFVTDTEKTTWNGKASTAVATTGANGLMSSTDKSKLDGIATGAQANQNAYTTVKVGTTLVSSASATGTLELAAGTNITLTPDATNKKVTIAASGGTASATSITDAGNYYAGTDVEAAMQEIGQVLNGSRGSLVTSMNSLINA